MIFTPTELAAQIGDRIKSRRIARRMTQAEAATRSGVSYATWRRLETSGKASIEDLIRAAVVLQCEDELQNLFPTPKAATMDELLRAKATKPARQRVRAMKS